MKKIVTLGAIAVLAAGFMFADEPAADVSVTEFSGNAKVTWGMDLDAGKTGFNNTTDQNFKIKLFGSGDKATEEADGLWADIKIKTDGLKLENGEWKDGKASVDHAKIKYGLGDGASIFVGIMAGDVQVGAYKFDGAIRSADSDSAKWIADRGAAKFTHGIEAGYDSNDINVTLNFRSYEVSKHTYTYGKDKDGKDIKQEYDATPYTNSYAVSLEAGLKDTNQWLSGLFVNAGFSYNLSGEYYDYGKNSYKSANWKKGNNDAFSVGRNWFGADEGYQNGHWMGYAFNAGYKLALDDTYFVKPAVAFSGSLNSGEKNIYNKDGGERWFKDTYNYNDVAFGVIFGWGANADDNAGVPVLDGDQAKKVTPGVSVVVDIPLVSTAKENKKTGKEDAVDVYTTKTHDAVIAYIVPSILTKGDFVEGLNAGLYSEIALLNYKEGSGDAYKDYVKSFTSPYGDAVTESTRKYETWNNAALKAEKFAFAVAGGVKYAYNADITVTPYAGFRFANRAYVENKINSKSPLSNEAVFNDLGVQDEMRTDGAQYHNTNGHLAGGFFNLKAGVEIGGLIDNTTFSLDYVSANLMNKTNYTSEKIPFAVYGASGDMANPNYKVGFNNKWYNVKLGHFDIGCKIAL